MNFHHSAGPAGSISTNRWPFSLGETVRLRWNDEEGLVLGAGEYSPGDCEFFVQYVNDAGVVIRQWLHEESIDRVKVLERRPAASAAASYLIRALGLKAARRRDKAVRQPAEFRHATAAKRLEALAAQATAGAFDVVLLARFESCIDRDRLDEALDTIGFSDGGMSLDELLAELVGRAA